MTITIDTKRILTCVLIFALGFGSGYYFHGDNKPVKTPKVDTTTMSTDTVTSTTVEYVPKESAEDVDVSANTKSHVLLNVNSTEYEIPTDKVTESHKFENGKLVIESEETHKIDLTDVVDDLGKEKYSRVGTADFGILYADSELYGGVRYNAKAWDAAYYCSVDGSKQGISVFYKF